MNKMLLTGTQVFGPATTESDIDIVMLWQEAEKLTMELRKYNITYSHSKSQNLDYLGFNFNLGILKLHVIVVSNKKEIEQYEYATKALSALPPIQDKKERHALFCEKKEEYRRRHYAGRNNR